MANPKTTNLGLNKVDRSNPTTTTFNTKPIIDDNADILDAAFGAAGHTHDGTAGNGPKITSAGLAADAATDTIIGNRTINDANVPAAASARITSLLGQIGNMIKQITGKANWYTSPRTTLENAVKRDGDTMTGNFIAPNVPNSTTAAVTYYVRTDGNDSNNGLSNTAGGAFRTIQKALDSLPKILYHPVTINVAAGTYPEDVVAYGFVYGGTTAGAGGIVIQSANTAQGATNVNSFSFQHSKGRFEIIGFTATTTTKSAFFSVYSSHVLFDSCWVSAVASGQHGYEFTSSQGRITGGAASNRNSGIMVNYYSQVFINGTGGTGNVIGVSSIISSHVGFNTTTAPTGAAAQVASQGGIIVSAVGTLNPWGDNTTSLRSHVRVLPAAAQPVNPNIYTKLQFINEAADHLSEWDTSNSKFTAKSAGVYLVTYSVTFTNTEAQKQYWCSINLNGQQNLSGTAHSSLTGADVQVTASKLLALNAGDTMEFYCQHNNSVARNVSGDGLYTHLQILKVG
ncbi:C1q-like domain-containing protein [Paenibacillus gansuensis]|uniref:C1q domain-containing protein n=1 Tax=Paenibacillus gansuensis TaxID=306542 RepID=A0ABW5PI42_9BACL